jgi:hypothetical protein
MHAFKSEIAFNHTQQKFSLYSEITYSFGFQKDILSYGFLKNKFEIHKSQCGQDFLTYFQGYYCTL